MGAEPVQSIEPIMLGRSHDPARDPLDAWTYRSAFRGHAAGVGVVTADDGRGPVGLTVSSIVSLSVTPPLTSLAVANRSSVLPTLRAAERLAIHFLGAHQTALARRFAAAGLDRFAGSVAWTRLPCGTPLLTEPPAYVAGSVIQQVPAGDHRILIVLLDRFERRRPYEPLVYAGGRYGSATATDS